MVKLNHSVIIITSLYDAHLTHLFSLDAPEGQKPGMPINVTVDAVSGGWVIRWKNPAVMPLYYTIEKKEDSQSAEWEPLTDHKIDPEEASYLSQY